MSLHNRLLVAMAIVGLLTPRALVAEPATAGPKAHTAAAHAPHLHPAGPHDADMAAGHAMLFRDMLPASKSEYQAISSGRWSQVETWKDGKVPAANGKVFIPHGVEVTIDRELAEPLDWVRVDGRLRFATDGHTLLKVDTIAVAPGGRLEMGTSREPVKAEFTAMLVIHPRSGNPIDHAFDPLEMGRGLLVQGAFESHGAEKTAFVPVSLMPAVGTDLIEVDRAPNGWQPGDELVLTATTYDQDETFRLIEINGRQVKLDHPIKHRRVLPTDVSGKPHTGLALHLGNLSRNAQIRSDKGAAGNVKLQGHVMLMHSTGHRLAFTGFYDLGRTTIRPLTDPKVREGRRDPGLSPINGLTQENVRGRYSLHFHRAGGTKEASHVRGCVVTVKRGSGLKIGIVNHSSHVTVRDCVSHNIDGSHYFTEEGDEIGDFTGNLAIHSVGSGMSHDEQPREVMLKAIHNDPKWYHSRRLDVGHRGTGFWLNGGGVDTIDNISAGQAHSGFHIWPRALDFRLKNTYAVRFPTSLLKDRSWVDSADIDINDVPIRFKGNIAYVLGTSKHRGVAGFVIDYFGIHTRERYPKAPYSEIHDLLSWNARGLRTSYAGNLHLKNVRIIGDLAREDDVGLQLRTQGGNSDIVEDVRIEGFARGIVPPARSVVRSGVIHAYVGMRVPGGQEITLDLGRLTFAEAPFQPAATSGLLPTSPFHLQRDMIFGGDRDRLSVAFSPQPIEVRGHPLLKDGGFYSLEQMPDYILPDHGIPGLLDGKTTTREAWERYRLAPGGAMAPANAAPLPGLLTNGLFGEAVKFDASLSYRDSAEPRIGFRPQVSLFSRKASVEGAPVELKSGWNLVPIEVDGTKRTILIHGGPIPRLSRVEAGGDQRIPLEALVMLSGQAERGAKVKWSKAYGPGEVSFEESTKPMTTARFGAPGMYVLHLTSFPAEGRPNTDSVVITVVGQR